MVLFGRGTKFDERIADDCYLTGIYIRMGIRFTANNFSGTSTNTPNKFTSVTYRVVLVLDKQCNGAATLWTDVFESPGGENPCMNFVNNDNSQRFVVLKDIRGVLQAKTTWHDTTNNIIHVIYDSKFIEIYWKGRIKIEFNKDTVTPTITDLKSNNVTLHGASFDDNVEMFSNHKRCYFVG